MREVIHCEQGSQQWHAVRLGIPTSSRFADIMAKGEGKTRRKYMMQLAGEIITGQPMIAYANQHMERGHEMEPEARDWYALVHGIEPDKVGFIRNGNKGCSPDALISGGGLLEIKTKLPDILLEVVLKDEIPPEHKAQLQGHLWVAEEEWIDLLCYWSGMMPFQKRTFRDQQYIRILASEVERFNDDLNEVVEKYRSMTNGI